MITPKLRFLIVVILLVARRAMAWSTATGMTIQRTTSSSTTRISMAPWEDDYDAGRREALSRTVMAFVAVLSIIGGSSPVCAYTPDTDKVRESLYLVSRVQEATVQQERFVNKGLSQEDLKLKMKLTLRLVEKNYRLLDQINFLSQYVQPAEELVTATNAGFEAADALQSAIDYVNTELKVGPLGDEQRDFLTSNLSTCREELFTFLDFVPQDKLAGARKRVEEENVLNREEYDGDGSEGVYNPVVLPWKTRQ